MESITKTKEEQKQELTEKWETHTQSAMQAIGSVKKSDITELKSFAAPPQAVKEVFALTMILLNAVKYKKNGKLVEP